MKYPKLTTAIFRYYFKETEYTMTFIPMVKTGWFNVVVKNESSGEVILSYEEKIKINPTSSLLALSNAIKINKPIKKSGDKTEKIERFKSINSVCPTASNKHHIGLQKDINSILNRYSKKWSYLKRMEPHYIHNGKDEFNMDGDEYTSIICAGIYKNAPFADRIDFLTKFLCRTEQQIKDLLFYHFTRYNAFMDSDYYQEVFVEFETYISLYFTKFYKPNYIYGH